MKNTLLITIAFIALSSAQSNQFQYLGLDLTLEQAQVDLYLDEKFPMKATLTNHGKVPVAIYIPDSPFADTVDNDFIETEPESSVYLEHIALKLQEDIDVKDIFVIEPEQYISRVFDLSLLRSFQEKQVYKVRLMFDLVFFLKIDPNAKYNVKEALQYDISSNYIVIKNNEVLPMLKAKVYDESIFKAANDVLNEVLENKKTLNLPNGGRQVMLGTPDFPCTASQQDILKKTVLDSQEWTRTGYNAYQDNSDELKKWFGKGSDNAGVQNIVTKVRDVYQNTNLQLNCWGDRCASNVFAYVFPADPNHNIYLCGQFWKATGERKYNSKSGTLIHESSHFVDVLASQDYWYGTRKAKLFAKVNPKMAMRNADNIEFYQENTDLDWSLYK